jgi:integrase
MKIHKSKRFRGIYHIELQNGDLSYYITYKADGKLIKQKIGLKGEGVNENVCNRIRTETIANLRIGAPIPIQTPIIKRKHSNVTLNDLADFYFDSQNGKSTHKWLGKYNLRIRNSIGDKDVALIDAKILESFRQSLIKANLAPSTTNCYIDIISAIFNYGIRNEINKGGNLTNPTRLLKKLKVDNKRERFLSKSEIIALLNYIGDDPTLFLFTKLALSTGARFQTLLNIRKMDVNLENRLLTLKDFKNESTYNGYITDDDLFDVLSNRMKVIGASDYLIREDGVRDISKYISRKMSSAFYDLFNYELDPTDTDYRKRKVVIHSLRHTMLSHLGLKGVSPFEIKQLSNHKSLSMVERYVKLNPESGREKVEGLYR